MKNKKTVIRIIEFYLFNQSLISREVQYRRHMKNTKSFFTISKLYKPINFEELNCIFGCIEKTLMAFSAEKKEYIFLRYTKKCTYDVIGGLMNKKRSSVFALGNEMLDEFFFDIMMNDEARKFILNAEDKCYMLPDE